MAEQAGALFELEYIGFYFEPDRAGVNPEWVRKSPYVARITGRDPKWGIAREFVTGALDYSSANATGSRGVFLVFLLSPGLYEVKERVSWPGWHRYYICVNDDLSIDEITRGEVELALASQTERTS